ncbi:hypothetical protein BDP27DRAFT_1426414 [Rhodocollybia butyracea]|uniref:Uncharacterized protein n=1 Tax=Rhodocollybia butyracea TaxID=206335 RepID=A0A9P5PID3_9AGAR|nr:hypothetical protein BDP27DRAFT_1426414 [Rhodocollybia butyracea]
MGGQKSAATIARIQALNASKHNSENKELEPALPDTTNATNTSRRTRNGVNIACLTAQIIAKDTQIAELEEHLAHAAKSHQGLENHVTLVTSKLEKLSVANRTLSKEKKELEGKLIASKKNRGIALRSPLVPELI